MNFSIRTRLTFSFAFVFSALTILFSGVVYYFMSSNLEKELHNNSVHNVQQVLAEFKELPWDRALKEMTEESEEFNIKIQILDAQKQVLFLTEGVKEWDWPVDNKNLEMAGQAPIWTDETINGVSHLVLTQPLVLENAPLRYLRVANSRQEINRIKNHFIYCINIGTPIVLILALLLGHWLSKKALEPVDRIRVRAQTINSDNLDERLFYDGPPDELHGLTSTLNQLFGRVQLTLGQMKRFIADASHELRIPLTGLRGTVEVALRQPRSNEEYKQTLETVYSESERLSELIWDLLSLARADAKELKVEKTEILFEEFMRNLFDEAETLNAEKRVILQLGSIPKGTVRFDETKIHQLLINLLENAIRYNKPGGTVTMSASMTDKNLVISIQDTGLGISPEDQSKIFDRFYRVDKARSREMGGTGLGLSIARLIAEAHNGTVTVKSVLGEGSEFTLILPLA